MGAECHFFLLPLWRWSGLGEVSDQHLFADEILFPRPDMRQFSLDAHLSDAIPGQSGHSVGGFVDGEHSNVTCDEF